MKMRVFPLNPDIIIHYEAHNDLSADHFMKGLYKVRSRLQMTSALYLLIRNRFLWTDHLVTPHQFFVSEDNPSIVRYREGLRDIAKEAKRQHVALVLSSFATIANKHFQISSKDYTKDMHYHAQFYPLTF